MGLIQHNINWIASPNSILTDCKSQKDLIDKIIHIETFHLSKPHLCLQNVDIYRLKQSPYESLMRNQRTFQCESVKLLEFSSTLKQLSHDVTHKNLVPVQFVKINEENNLCMKTVKIDYYATYYGIELRDIVENRKNQDRRFQQGQILYVAKSLISLGLYLQKHNIAFGTYQSKNIFVSDNGYIKLYLFHMLPQNKHINYYHLLSSKHTQLSLHLPIAPQMFSDLQQNNMTPNFDCYKADLFCIGMVLVDMMVESSLGRYYRFGKEGMVFDEAKLKKDLSQIREKSVYNEKIIDLLECILCIRSEDRLTFQQADKYLDQLKKELEFAYRLNLMNDNQQQSEFQPLQNTQLPQSSTNLQKNKISFKSQEPQSQYVLRSIQNTLESKLNPLPLKSLSKNCTNHQTEALSKSKQRKNMNMVDEDNLNDVSIQRSIYTRRRNTGVSIISSSSNHQNNRSFSKRDEKSSKFTTVRNSRVGDQFFLKNEKESFNTEKEKLSQFGERTQIYEKSITRALEKQHQNWLTLGSTRITEENSKNLTLLPPKSSQSSKTNPKLHLNLHGQIRLTKQPHSSEESNLKKQSSLSSSISTHIKMHKKNITSPKNKTQKQKQPQTQKLSQMQLNLKNSEDSKQNLMSCFNHNKTSNQFNEASSVEKLGRKTTVRPKMKLNHHFRG